MQYDAPLVLVAAPLVALLVMSLGFWARRARTHRAARWSDELSRTARAANRWVPLGLGLVALLAMGGLAGPRWGRQVVITDTQALDLVIAVDLSRSMLAEDVDPSRLAQMQRQVRRLVFDLAGDRLGLIGFAGRSFILSPLTVDGSALQLLIDALHPELVSAGGTALADALRQGRELLLASERLADRVLVVFSDGETHDSLPRVIEAAEQLRRDGVRLILVAEGGTEPVQIPVRSSDGQLTGFHRDVDDNLVLTSRNDDVFNRVADAAEGVVVAAGLDDQAGAVRNLVQAYKRAPESSTAAAHDIPRGWLPVSAAILLLLLLTVTRPTAALVAVACMVLAGHAAAQGPRNAGDDAWRAADFARAAELYGAQARAGVGGDTTWYNAGTAALASGHLERAGEQLARAAESLDPEIRFRALYNLGLTALRRAVQDSAHAAQHLADARAVYRAALLLRPGDDDAKWNLELATVPPPPGSGGGEGEASPPPSGGTGSGTPPPATPPPARLTREQAEQILQSIAAEERETRMDLGRRGGPVREARRAKDW